MGKRKNSCGNYTFVETGFGLKYRAPDWETIMRPAARREYEIVLSTHYDACHTYIVRERKGRNNVKYHMFYYTGNYPKTPTRYGELTIYEHEYAETDDFYEFQSWCIDLITLFAESEFLSKGDQRKQWLNMERMYLEDK